MIVTPIVDSFNSAVGSLFRKSSARSPVRGKAMSGGREIVASKHAVMGWRERRRSDDHYKNWLCMGFAQADLDDGGQVHRCDGALGSSDSWPRP